MDKFFKQSTPKTPRIEFDAENSSFLIQGRSIPENSTEYYRPLIEWLEEYMKSPSAETHINIDVEYFNTSTSKCFVEMFRKLESIMNQSDVRVIWYYDSDDEDMQESVEDFKKVIRIPIELKAKI